jgi:hypothetical protein
MKSKNTTIFYLVDTYCLSYILRFIYPFARAIAFGINFIINRIKSNINSNSPNIAKIAGRIYLTPANPHNVLSGKSN